MKAAASAPTATTVPQDIRVEQVTLLFRYLPVSIVANLLIAGCVSFALYPLVATPRLGAWLAVMLGAVLLRSAGCLAVRRRPVDLGSATRAETLFIIGACATGAAWGFSFPLLDIESVVEADRWFAKAIVIVCGAGIAAGGAFVMAHRPWPPRFFVASILLPAFAYFVSGSPREQLLAALIAIFLGFMLRSTSMTSAAILRGMVLHREAAASAQAAVASARQRDIAFEELRSLSAAHPDLLLKFDRDGGLLWANPSAERILGSDLRQRQFADCLGSGQPDAVARLWEAAEGSVSHSCEMRLQTLAGEKPYLLSVAPQRDPDGRMLAVVCIGQDISTMKNIAAQLEQARDVAEQASRAKSEFLANMSHEIRTPLNAIIGLAELALDRPLSVELRDYLEHIRRSGANLLGIVNDILDFSKIEAGKVELDSAPFDPVTVLDLLRSHATVLAQGKDLVIDVAAPPELPQLLRGDALRVSQVLTNLVSNAVKFTPHGRVEVSTEIVTPGATALSLAFHVRDTGIGMTPEQTRRVFQPFTQADTSTTRRFGGTGLGLSICRRLVDLMGGRLEMASEVGKGSHVTVVLPFPLAGPRPTAPVPAAPPPRASFNGRRALLAEDHPVNRLVAGATLEQLGLEVDFAVDGRQALERFTQATTHYDVVFMDVQMPEMDGLEATRGIRRTTAGAGIPIIGVTANAFAQDRQDCLDAGMSDFLAKPFRPQELATVLARWVATDDAPPAGNSTTPG